MHRFANLCGMLTPICKVTMGTLAILLAPAMWKMNIPRYKVGQKNKKNENNTKTRNNSDLRQNFVPQIWYESYARNENVARKHSRKEGKR